MVVDDTVGLHHLEFHTTEPEQLVDTFIRTYGFVLSATRTTPNYRQWFLESHQCRLIISSTTGIGSKIETDIDKNHYDILTTLLGDEANRTLVVDRKTVFNVAVTVQCVQSLLERNPEVKVLVPRSQAVDKHGTIEYACIKSIVGNVVHTIIDLSKYTGPYLPGFTPAATFSYERQPTCEGILSAIDHVAIAVPRKLAHTTLNWYESVLGMTRFTINREDDPFGGFPVHVGSLGMLMFAGIYWKCSETGCADASKKLKFVFVESLIDADSKASDQITTFITNHHGQGGIQHIAFSCTTNIKSAVRAARANGAEFLTPHFDYYSQENNGKVIERVGESTAELSDLGILLDDEADGDSEASLAATTRVLLQIFTKSLFHNDTFFLEFIERRGANGFGSGNVRTLWKIVQNQMDKNA